MKYFSAAPMLALAVSAGSALAADLPSKKLAPMLPPPPPPLWSGFYVGLNAGYAWDESNVLVNSPLALGSIGPSGSGALSPGSDGFIGGGQIGYNHQFGQTFVVGLEADLQGVAHGGGGATLGKFVDPVTSTINASKQLDYLGTVRGRVGYLVAPNLLVFGTGGLAYGQANVNASLYQSRPGVVPDGGDVIAAEVPPNTTAPATGSAIMSFSDTRVGWTVGGGLEWLFLPQWSAKVEYLYYNLGTVSAPGALTFAGAVVGVTTASSEIKGHVVRAGVNYHFDLFNPAPSKF